MLHEELRILKQELGKGILTQQFKDRIKDKKIPPKILNVINEELV
jgi:ATP-dependent Lon protease